MSPYGGRVRRLPAHRCPCGKGGKHTGTLPDSNIRTRIDDLIFTLEHPAPGPPRRGEVNSRNWRERMINRLLSIRDEP